MEAPIKKDSSDTPTPLLFYDGDCGFCNAAVQFVLRHERAPVLKFAPLQGITAAQILAAAGIKPDVGPDGTLIIWDNGQLLIRSQAVLRAMTYIGGPWRLFSRLLHVIPTPLADLFYRLIARSRSYLPAGRTCALRPPEQMLRILP